MNSVVQIQGERIDSTDIKKAQRIVRDMFHLSHKYNLNGVHDMIGKLDLDTFVDRNIDSWSEQITEVPLNRLKTTLSAN